MKIISFFTKNTPYETEINNKLIRSLNSHNLDYDIEGIDDLGSWQANTGYKCQHIKKMLLKHKEPVCFMDADAIIIRPPVLLDQLPKDVDLAYHFFNWFGHWRGQWENTSNIQLLSGTMMWGYNERVLSLIDEWIEKIKTNQHIWEQKVLEDIVYARNDLNIYNLPAEYCCVLMQDNSIPKYINKETLSIVHTQASRKYKNRRLWPENLDKQ
jgi:hypothetical protein